MNLQKFRKLQYTISVFVFVCVFSFFYHVTKFKLTDIQLSFWGINKEFGFIWNATVVLISISFFLNFKNYVLNNIRLKTNKIIDFFFLTTFVSLFFVGLINMNIKITHDIFAGLYFLCYPLGIFSFAHYNIKNLSKKDWLIHLSFFVFAITIPLLLIPLHSGLAIPEIAHSILIMGWNFYILYF